MPTQSDNPPELMTLEQWKGLNQQVEQGSIDDQEEFWNENLFSMGPGSLRACWGRGPLVYTAPSGTTILRTFFGFYGNQTPQFSAPPPGAMGWMFLSDGTVDEVDLNTTARGLLRSKGQIWNPIGPQYWASAKVWRPQFYGSQAGQQGGVLFGSPEQAGGGPPGGLYAWDGATLTAPGQPAPDWLTDLQETNPGATPPNMPIGLPGIYAMEVYQSRLWIAGKDVISFSAPSNGADFSTTNGGGSFGYFGDKLVYSYVDLHAASGYLFVYGDSSTDLIANLQLSGSGTVESPYTTNFTYENIDPQTGQRFPRPVGVLGRNMILFNMAGFYLMQGADAQPIGDKTINIWNTLDTSLYLPTFATVCMHGFRVLLVNGRFKDPFGVTRNLLLMWHPQRGKEFWSVASQGVELTNIGTYQQDSCEYAYGTDGVHLWRLFAQPDATLIKRLVTKQFRGQGLSQLTVKNWIRAYAELTDKSGLGVSINGTLETGDGGVPGGRQSLDFELTRGVKHKLIPFPLEGHGIWGALDLQSNSPDFVIQRVHLTAHLNTLFGA
jgi:hypothetical protein